VRIIYRRPCLEKLPQGEGVMCKLRKVTPRVAAPGISLILSIFLRYPEEANRIILVNRKYTGSIPIISIINLLIPERGISGGLSEKDESTVP
jgi:hypothetical protein